MIRLVLDTSDDLLPKIKRQTNEIITNIYDDIDNVLPEWADSPDDFFPKQDTPKQVPQANYPAQFSSTKSVLLNTVCTNYNYPTTSIYHQ